MTNLYEQFKAAGDNYGATLRELHTPLDNNEHNHITFATWAKDRLNQSKEDN